MSLPTGETAIPTSESRSSSYLERMLNVLEATVVARAEPLSLTEIVELAGVPLSTASRLVRQLVSWDFLATDGRGRYVAGGRLVRLSITVTDRLHSVETLAAATESLSELTGESVTAGLLVGSTLLIVARTESRNSLRNVSRIGEVISPSLSALGKAMLSHLPHADRVRLLRAEHGRGADAMLRGLRDELTTAAAAGYAVDEETYAVGLRCRAAAIIGRDGRAVGGLSIGGPAARFTRELAAQAVVSLVAETSRLSVADDLRHAARVPSESAHARSSHPTTTGRRNS
ncbi:MAG TPA: IclR family transcriptional regulator [Gryllotalpicola sp.]